MDIWKIVDHVGFNGPIILFSLSLLLLRHKRKTLFIYIVGSIINVIVNYLLKMIIKQPRPVEDNINLEWNQINDKRENVDKYGMPSGHAQMTWFSTMFVFLVLKDFKWLLFFMIISLNTVFQRFKYNNHTTFQLMVGTVIGLTMGYLFYEI